eukprot:5666468-Pleurochrysis_carterae.AAC.1
MVTVICCRGIIVTVICYRSANVTVKRNRALPENTETTYGVWQGPESATILGNKRKKATVLQTRMGVTLDQMDKTRAVEQGSLSKR